MIVNGDGGKLIIDVVQLSFDQSEGHCKNDDVRCKPSSFKYF